MSAEPQPPENETPDDEPEGPSPGFLTLLRENKRWWLGPIVVVALLLLLLVLFSASQSLPFMYRLVQIYAPRGGPWSLPG